MIVAGIGCRKGVSMAEVIAAVKTALETHGLALGALSALATTAFKREERAIFEAGRELGLRVIVVEGEGLLLDGAAPPLTCLLASSPRERREGRLHQGFRQSTTLQNESSYQGQPPSPRSWGEGPSKGMRGSATAAANPLTHSDLSQVRAGVPSVSEAAALAAAGDGARLYGPRIVVGPVTCALAEGGDPAS